ncbi:transcriptional regulator [Aciduliprofundum sp. MAR08-339]|uniref:transcriptional regulator n=1 Tax=Aciduliprofundum sp. (strain MAR08-339) TaxID=673860 RepID=UPI0002A47EE6|nr:transcriptional regulator [Aciduliprofundum sp. MAR08-339]
MLRDVARKSVVGNPIRLSILIYLLPRRRALFKELLNAIEITPGNLDSHLKTLEKNGLVRIGKVLLDRPRTAVWITDRGVKETREYIKLLREHMEGNVKY